VLATCMSVGNGFGVECYGNGHVVIAAAVVVGVEIFETSMVENMSSPS
jgi:hypothetical protein